MTEFKVGDRVSGYNGLLGRIVRVHTLYDVHFDKGSTIHKMEPPMLRRVSAEEELADVDDQIQKQADKLQELSDKKKRITDQLAAKSQS